MDNEDVSIRSQLYWSTLSRIPFQIISFGISIFVARILDPKDFGIMGIVMMLIGYANLLTNFGFNAAVIQRKIHDKKVINSIFIFDLFVSVLLAGVFVFLSGYISAFFKTPECEQVIKVMSLLFVITSFTGIPSAILRRDMNFKVVSLFGSINALLTGVTTVILALNHFGYWALVYGQLVPLALTTMLLCVNTRWFPMLHYSHADIKGVLNFGTWNFIKAQLEFVAQNADKFIIGRWLGPTSLGFYDRAMSLAGLPVNSITMNINSVMFSSFSKSSEDNDQLQQHFKKSLALLSFINFPIYLGLIVIAPYLVYTILGSKWTPMILVFQILLVGLIIKSFGGLVASLNIGIGRYREHTRRFSIAVAVLIISCILLLKLNIEGIALGFLIFVFVDIYLLMSLAIRSISLFWRDVFNSISPGVSASVFVFVTTKAAALFWLTELSLINMVLLVIIGSLAFCLYTLLFDSSNFTKEFRHSIWMDIKRLQNMA